MEVKDQIKMTTTHLDKQFQLQLTCDIPLLGLSPQTISMFLSCSLNCSGCMDSLSRPPTCLLWYAVTVALRPAQLCLLTSRRMLIPVRLNHWASLSCTCSSSASSILSPARGKVAQFTQRYLPCLNPAAQRDNTRQPHIQWVEFMLE